MSIEQYFQQVGQQARQAARHMARATRGDKDRALAQIAASLKQHRTAILAANAEDMAAGRSSLDAALLDRLELTPSRFDAMIEGLEQVMALADPVGEISDLK